jgi:flagellar protein FlaJ
MKKEKHRKIKTLFQTLNARLKSHFVKRTRTKKTPPEGKVRVFEKAHSLAYQLIGQRTGRILPLFRDLDSNLYKSGLKVNFKAYVSLAVMIAASTSLIVLGVMPCLLFVVFKVPLLPTILFSVGGSLFVLAFSIIGFYCYPIYCADELRRDLEDELPFTTGYMAILTSAGVSPERVFSSLSSLSVQSAVSEQSKDIVRDVSLFGSDIISALEEASKRTPSQRFQEMLEGLISTIHSGGNMAAYLRGKSAQYMKLKRISLRKFSDTLSILSEVYVTLLITGPLLLVIMLAVMAMLGGGGLGELTPDLILDLLTYIGIPLGSIMFLIVLDSASPKW